MPDNRTPFYDVVIVGAGPGGLFAAYELVQLLRNRGQQAKILVVDKGKAISERHCLAVHSQCINCRPCELIAGEGGAGLFSDGKLVFDLYSGGHLKEILPRTEKDKLEDRIKSIVSVFDVNYIYREPDFPIERALVSGSDDNGLKFKPYPVLHLGSANLRKLTSSLKTYLQEQGINFLFDTYVSDLYFEASQWWLETGHGSSFSKIRSQHVIVSVGKEGNFWFSSVVEKLGGNAQENNTYMGVRMEISDYSARYMRDLGLDPKIYQSLSGAKIKTHCFCNHGEVLLLKYFGLPVAGGHSPSIETDDGYAPGKYPSSNLAILYRNPKYCTREKAIDIMREISSITGGRLLVQRLGDYLNDIPTSLEQFNNHRVEASNRIAIPGRISADFLPGFRDVFLAFLRQLSLVVPGIIHLDNLLYAPAVEWWMRKIEVTSQMEVSNLANLYAIGDGSGWTQGIVQSSGTGVIAARAIMEGFSQVR